MYSDTYSIWLSTRPCYEVSSMTDDEFMFLGSSASFPVSMTYTSSTTGVIGQTPDTAIFVDGSQGAVMNMNVTTERVNPVNYIGLTTSPPTDAQIGDSTNQEFLKSLGVDNYDVCIVTVGNDFQSSLETTSLLKEMGGKMVVARAEREVQEKFLLRNGADKVVNPEKQVAEWTAIRYTTSHICDYIELDDDHAIYEVEIPGDWIGKSIIDINIRQKYGINILGIKKNGRMDGLFTPNEILNANMTLLVLGEIKSIEKCFKS